MTCRMGTEAARQAVDAPRRAALHTKGDQAMENATFDRLVRGIGARVAGRLGRGAAAQDATPADGSASPGSCPATTPEQNAEIARRWYEAAWDKHDAKLFDELLADDIILHFPSRPGFAYPATLPPHNAADVQRLQAWLAAFPDLHVVVDDLIAQGDRVAARTTWSGTQVGPIQVLGAPATARRMQVQAMTMLRFRCGQIAEQWVSLDDLTMLRQLGVITDDELATAGAPTVATPTA